MDFKVRAFGHGLLQVTLFCSVCVDAYVGFLLP